MLATLSVRSFVLTLAVFAAGEGCAAGATIVDGGTMQVAGVTYRLEGIDAPELDQMCIDEHADPWTCGAEARDQLARLIGDRQVGCEDLGADAVYRKRHAGICTVEGEAASLNQVLVRQGFAVNSESPAKGRFAADETAAKDHGRDSGKAALWLRRNSGAGERTAPCWAKPAEPTRTAKYARCYSLTTPRCHRVAASRVSLPPAPASPGMWGSITCRGAAATLPSQGLIAGFAPRKTPRPKDSGKPSIAGQAAGGACNKFVVQQH